MTPMQKINELYDLVNSRRAALGIPAQTSESPVHLMPTSQCYSLIWEQFWRSYHRLWSQPEPLKPNKE